MLIQPNQNKNVQYSTNVLDDGDYRFLCEYITDDPSIAYQRFPMYSFLPKDEPAENHIEKILRTLTPGKEHIEYWFRWNDEAPWHVDGDEVLFKAINKETNGSQINYKKDYDHLDHNPEDPNSSRIAKTTHILYLIISNMLGGELEVCTSERWKGKFILDNKWEPPNGANIITFQPHQNMAVRFPSYFYHRVLPIRPKFEKLPFKRLALIWCTWDHYPKGYEIHKHFKLNESLEIVPAKGWRDFTAVPSRT